MAISPTNFRIIFTNYDIITYFLNLASCSKHFISIKHRILATFNINKKNQSERLYAFKLIHLTDNEQQFMYTSNRQLYHHCLIWIGFVSTVILKSDRDTCCCRYRILILILTNIYLQHAFWLFIAVISVR
jgi:hypothetical protein